MALKDEILNSYFSAPLSRRKKFSESSESSDPAVPKKRRFFHDKEDEPDSLTPSEENKKSIGKASEDFKKVLYDKTLDIDDVSSINNKGNGSLELPLKANSKTIEKRNARSIKEGRHNTGVFFPVAPGILKELSILIKKTKGLQKDVLLYIIDKCRDSGSLDSGPVDLIDISNKYNSPVDFVRTAIKRLVAKNLIMKGNGKTGPTGYSVFYIPSEVKEIILNIHHF